MEDQDGEAGQLQGDILIFLLNSTLTSLFCSCLKELNLKFIQNKQSSMKTDIEIAQSAVIRPIVEVAARLGLERMTLSSTESTRPSFRYR